MCEFFEILSQRQSILDELKEEISIAEERKEMEILAATNIQRCFKGHVVRKLINEQNAAAIQIQRLARSLLARTYVKNVREQKLQYEQTIYYNYMSILIQKVFRAYYSRRYIHDFYARKHYIETVVQTSNDLKDKMAKHLEIQLERTYEDDALKRQKEFEYVTSNLHHLVSTKAINGIYNSPFLANQGGVTTYGQPVEGCIKTSTIKAVRNTLKHHRKSLKPYQYNPSSNSHLTLRQTAPWGIVEKEARIDTKFSKIKRITPRDFVIGTKIHYPLGEKTVLESDPFIDPWKIPQATKS